MLEAPQRKNHRARPVEVPLTDEARREAARRKEVAELAKRASELDRELFGSILAAETPGEAIEKIETIESLAFGKELERHEVGEKSVNAVTRRVFEGDPPRIAYVKPQGCEGAFVYDASRRAVYRTVNAWDERQARYIETRWPIPGLASSGIKRELENRGARKERVAKHYGIDAQDVPLSGTETTAKYGIDPGKGAIREYIVSRINELLRFDVVPLTALRAEKGNVDLSSVQEAAKSTNPERPSRFLSDEEAEEIIERGPQYPGARSMMRMACLDYLVKSSDRHVGNMLFDPESKQFTAIDNGYSMGLSEHVETESVGAEKSPASRSIDRYLSIPMEIVKMHPDWELDDEARANLFELQESIKHYLSAREKEPGSRGLGAGKEIKYITKLFRLLYGNEQIAKKEALDFMDRIGRILALGRPPKLPEAELSPRLKAERAMRGIKVE